MCTPVNSGGVFIPFEADQTTLSPPRHSMLLCACERRAFCINPHVPLLSHQVQSHTLHDKQPLALTRHVLKEEIQVLSSACGYIKEGKESCWGRGQRAVSARHSLMATGQNQVNDLLIKPWRPRRKARPSFTRFCACWNKHTEVRGEGGGWCFDKLCMWHFCERVQCRWTCCQDSPCASPQPVIHALCSPWYTSCWVSASNTHTLLNTRPSFPAQLELACVYHAVLTFPC